MPKSARKPLGGIEGYIMSITQKIFAIKWLDTGIKNNREALPDPGSIDVFPVDVFQGEKTIDNFPHLVLGIRGGHYNAICRINNYGDTAELNYEVFSKQNISLGMLPGILRLHFKDSSRKKLISCDWKPSDNNRYIFGLAEPIKNPLPTQKPYIRKQSNVKKNTREVRERAGQVKFRETLMIAYGGRCCITECNVGAALEGAHIDPFYGSISDNPQNGLLVRRDIHALFDCGLLAINPKNGLVHISSEAQAYPEYKAIHKRVSIRPPVYGDSSYRPSIKALQRRWEKFEEA